MNKDRRKQIAIALEWLAIAKDKLENVKAELEQARDDERAYYDNMPESVQAGEKGERASAAADALDDACNEFSEIESLIETIEAHCEGASE